ncbi:MAG: thioredoxin domain-containing protein [Candidatus Doudnabacteria bacterium]|nr:thioredoxin domain-containing protein [Candidatus Doudnabacteria bacterium]
MSEPTPSTESAPKEAGKMGELLDTMTSRLAFRVGFFSGALILSGVLFVFLFIFFGINNGNRTTGTVAGGTADSINANAGDALGLPSPYEDVLGEVALAADDHIRGDKDADFLLIEYSDYECPFCKNFHGTPEQIMELAEEKGTSVAWVYRHFPLSFHEGAFEAAIASECVNEQAGSDGFWAFTDAYYAKTRSNGWGIDRDKWGEMAKEAGVANVQQFEACVDSEKYGDQVNAEQVEAELLGVTGTPGNIILNQKTGEAKLISGAYPLDAFEEVIDLLR